MKNLQERGSMLLQGNSILLGIRDSITEDYRVEREKYLRDKDYFLAVLEMVGSGYSHSDLRCVCNAIDMLKSSGYAYYISNNTTNVCDMGRKRFAYRYEMDKNRLVASVGVHPSIFKEIMRLYAQDVPKGLLVMKRQGRRAK